MKYLAISLLSLASLLTAAGASPAALPTLMPDVALVFEQGASIGDRALAGVLAATLIALQLRRRQKSLRMPRALN